MNGPQHKHILLTIGGDFCPNGRIENHFWGSPLSDLTPIRDAKYFFAQTDLAVVNLECPLTSSNDSIAKEGPCLKAHPDMAHILDYLGVGLVTLANNHIRDFGERGVLDTLDVCKRFAIDTVGAVLTLDEASRIYYRDIKGRTLAVINMAENEFANATPGPAGANPLDLISLIYDIREAREKAAHVILILHGGLEYTHYPSPVSVRLLRFLAEQGPTAIIRHHPHYVQGIEVWKGVPIFYSLGNFWADSANRSRPGWFEGILITLKISPRNICTYEIHPFHQCKEELMFKFMAGAEMDDFFKRLKLWSDILIDHERHGEAWNGVIEKEGQIITGC